MRKKKKIQFSDRYHPLKGIISTLIGAVSILLMCILFIGSGFAGGDAGYLYGVLGTVNMVVSVVGAIIAVRCYRSEEIYHLYPNIGLILNLIVTLLYMILYVIGMM